jgi:hypothetical protein
MTFDMRADRLAESYALTPRQARFLCLVALIGGYCLRRQYGAYARIALGKNPAFFLDRLVDRGLATRDRPRRHRSFVYHLKHRRAYEVLGLDNNRHRRPVLPTRQARRLMLLDYAIEQHDAIWFATEADKVALFTRALDIPAGALPSRTYRSDRPDGGATVRQFVLKWPIFQRTGDSTIHFVYLGLETSGQGFATFLAHHAHLFDHLAAWRVVVVYPPMFRASTSAWRSAFSRAYPAGAAPLSPHDARELHAYFRVQHALDGGHIDGPLTIDQTHDQRRRRYATSPYRFLFSHWRLVGGPHLPPETPPDFSRCELPGRLDTHELSWSYDLFGSFPGLA